MQLIGFRYNRSAEVPSVVGFRCERPAAASCISERRTGGAEERKPAAGEREAQPGDPHAPDEGGHDEAGRSKLNSGEKSDPSEYQRHRIRLQPARPPS